MPNCLIYKACRWKDLKKTKGKKVANKVMRYFPLTPRLQRMCNTKHIAKWMTWHATGQSKENGKMNHPCDGRAWTYFDMMKPEFSGDPRNMDMKAMQDRIKAGIIPFKTDQEILDEVVPSDNRQNMSGIDRKLPGGGSTSRRRTHRAYGDVMNRDQMTQILRQQEQEKELYRKQAEEAQ
ncbi:hypothetical protein Tco_1460944, partial [Tanacetum coccineum]